MSALFNLDNPFWRFMSKLGDMIMLTVVWLVCCIPIVTIGPATTAMYYVMLKLVRDLEGSVFKQYFKSFKENLKQGMIIGVIMTLLGAILLFDLTFYKDATGQIASLLWWASLIFFIIWAMVSQYIYALLAKFVQTVKRYFMFGLFLSIRHFGYTVLMLLVSAVALIVIYFYPPFVLMAMGVVAYVNSKMLVVIFDKYIPDELKEVNQLKDPDQGFGDGPADGKPAEEEPVHIVMDINEPTHVVLGDTSKMGSGKEEK